MGGNFYGSPDGYGFSQTSNSTDGIADYPFTITTENIDYLPLALYPPGPPRPEPEPVTPPVPPPEPWEPTAPQSPGLPSTAPAEMISASIPASASPGEVVGMAVTIKNNQEVSWGPDDYVTLQVWMTDPNGVVVSQVVNVQVSDGTTVYPGQSYQFNFNMQMPAQEGTNQLNFQLWKYVNDEWVKLGTAMTKPITVGGENNQGKEQGLLTASASMIPEYTLQDNIRTPLQRTGIDRAAALNRTSDYARLVNRDPEDQPRHFAAMSLSSTSDFSFKLNITGYGTGKYINAYKTTTPRQNLPDRGDVP
jgi:hypothetical protein